MKVEVEIINYKTGLWLYKEGSVTEHGKQYTVKLMKAPYNYGLKLTGKMMKFIHGNTVYIVPEYYSNTVNEFIIFMMTGKKNFQRTLEKEKSNKLLKLIMNNSRVVDSVDNVMLVQYKNSALIVSGKSIYYDNFDRELIESIKNIMKTQ